MTKIVAWSEYANPETDRETLKDSFEVFVEDDEGAEARYAEVLELENLHSASICAVLRSTDYDPEVPKKKIPVKKVAADRGVRWETFTRGLYTEYRMYKVGGKRMVLQLVPTAYNRVPAWEARTDTDMYRVDAKTPEEAMAKAERQDWTPVTE